MFDIFNLNNNMNTNILEFYSHDNQCFTIKRTLFEFFYQVNDNKLISDNLSLNL